MRILFAFLVFQVLLLSLAVSAFSQKIPVWGNESSTIVLANKINVSQTGHPTLVSGNMVSTDLKLQAGINQQKGNFARRSATRVQAAFTLMNNQLGRFHTAAIPGLTTKNIIPELNNLRPGIYEFGNLILNHKITLDNKGDQNAFYLFRISGSLDVQASVVMKGGFAGKNVFWQVSGEVTVQPGKSVAGNIIAAGQVSLLKGSDVTGHVFSARTISLAGSNVNMPLDTDGDGVNDLFDDYPEDAARAFNNYTPAAVTAFEDRWPAKGDYDMNDLVMKSDYNIITNAGNEVVQVIGTFTLMATGDLKNNGFGIEFPISQELIYKTLQGSPEPGQHNAVFILFRNMRAEMKYWNTVPGQAVSVPKVYTVSFLLKKGVKLADFGLDGYNPFIVNYLKGARLEVHLPGKQPTNLADRKFFGTADDYSTGKNHLTYTTRTGLPWAISVPESDFSYPVEGKDISNVYLHFADWANSGGNAFTDWYSNPGKSYRNQALIYKDSRTN